MESKVFFALVLVLAYANVCWSQTSYSTSSTNTGGVRIFNDGRFLHCHDFVCPEATERCVVTVKTDERDFRRIETWKRCLDRDNKIIAEDRKFDYNPNPSEAVNVHVESARDGSISSANSNHYSGSTNYMGGGSSSRGSFGERRNGAGSIQQWLTPVYIFMSIFFVNKFM